MASSQDAVNEELTKIAEAFKAMFFPTPRCLEEVKPEPRKLEFGNHAETCIHNIAMSEPCDLC